MARREKIYRMRWQLCGPDGTLQPEQGWFFQVTPCCFTYPKRLRCFATGALRDRETFGNRHLIADDLPAARLASNASYHYLLHDLELRISNLEQRLDAKSG